MKVARSDACRGFHAEGDPEPGRCDWYTRRPHGAVFVRCALPRGHEGGHNQRRGAAARSTEAVLRRRAALS